MSGNPYSEIDPDSPSTRKPDPFEFWNYILWPTLGMELLGLFTC